MEEIEKLRVRVEKDPNSRLFLPLAEEYRKAGLPDEAISVILRGLERQPGYTSARVALGRIYLEKSMLDEARREFETVVKSIPDNLFAHRKLADIYRDIGEIEKAITEYETVLKLNPIDEDAKMCLSEITGSARPAVGIPEVVPEKTRGIEGPLQGEENVATGGSAEEIEGKVGPELASEEAGQGEEAISQDLEKFMSSFADEEAGEEPKEEPKEAPTIPADLFFELPDEASFDDILPVTAEEVKEDDVPKVQDLSKKLGGVPDLSAADSLILNGNFFGALEVYKKFLEKNPDDKRVLQKVVELKHLMKLTGKDGEALIAHLETFLNVVKRGFPKRL